MKHLLPLQKVERGSWCWPINRSLYDLTPVLTKDEQSELDTLICLFNAPGNHTWQEKSRKGLHRLVQPIIDVLEAIQAPEAAHSPVIAFLLRQMHSRCCPFWAWGKEDWQDILCPDSATFAKRHKRTGSTRTCLMAVAYLLGDFPDISALGNFCLYPFAVKIFGKLQVDTAIERVGEELKQWGYGTYRMSREIPHALCLLFLVNRSPYLEDLTIDLLDAVRRKRTRKKYTDDLFVISRALASLKMLSCPLPALPLDQRDRLGNGNALDGVPAEWASFTQRWVETSTLAPQTRKNVYYRVLAAGRWLAQEHPEVETPAQWTRELAAEYVAAIDRMKIGQCSCDGKHPTSRPVGKPFSARSKNGHLGALRIFFRDCQEWGWTPNRFNPTRALATPRSIRALIGPDPRMIADDIWAKLLWAGLNLAAEDLPGCTYPKTSAHGVEREPYYPLEMVHAMVMVWLFAGLRSNELRRLRVGCVRWQREDATVPGTHEVLPKDTICLLDIPIHKTGTSFTKAVDLVVGEAITRWERIRPDQPATLDEKTGELVHLLFSYRGRHIGASYLNDNLIPLLCRKGGIPRADTRGSITSHRARSTIASMLYNAKEPLSLFDLQEWLGHLHPSSTQYYVKKSLTKVAKAYEKAGYFRRNIRTIEVLIDQDVMKRGAVANGEPWRFYDLGHGYCLYEFFDQCPHRMACAKCAFYRPKGSAQAQLLEGKANLLYLLQEIPVLCQIIIPASPYNLATF